jgi:hypothetical protein
MSRISQEGLNNTRCPPVVSTSRSKKSHPRYGAVTTHVQQTRSIDTEKLESTYSTVLLPHSRETLRGDRALSMHRVPRQRRLGSSVDEKFNKGLWSEYEQRLFLEGLTIYGWGQWKEIGTILTSRYVLLKSSDGEKAFSKSRKLPLLIRSRILVPTGLIAK